MARTNRHYFAGVFTAQEARKQARAGDYEYATGQGNAAAVVDTSMAGVQSRGQRDCSLAAANLSGLGAARTSVTFSCVLPMPPSVNDIYGTNYRTGQKFLVAAQVEFRALVCGLLAGEVKAPLRGRLSLSVTWFFVRAGSDISNRWKALEDALEHAGVYVNDSQIDEQHGYRGKLRDVGECHVMLAELAA